MVQLLTTFGDSSSGIGALGFNAKSFVIQLITFILAYFVLRRYAFQPIIKVLRERRETIENGVSLGEQMKQQQAEMEAAVEKALHEARKQADGIIADAQDTGRQAIRDAEGKARDKAAGILASAEDRIAQESNHARQQLKKEIVGLIADTTEVIIHEKVDSKKDAALIESALKGKQAA